MNKSKIIRSIILPPLLTLLLACNQTEDKARAVEPAAKAGAETTQPAPTQTGNAQTDKAHPENTEATNESKDHDHNHDHAHESSPLAGKGWVEIEPQMSCEQPVVMEFFAYQCPHCNKLEPWAEKWQVKNQTAKFVGIPTHLGHREFGAALLVHEAAKNLGVLGMATPMLFDRIHKEHQLFASEQEAIDFLVSAGAQPEAAKAALNDQEKIQKAINENFSIMQKYKITGVPTIIVNHRYKTDVTIAGGYDKVFEQVDKMLKLPSDCGSASQ